MHIVSHFAYLDAGTGSLIIQAVIGVVAGISVFGRRIFGNIRNKFGALTHKKSATQETAKDKAK